MGIYEPVPRLGERRRRLLYLLSKLIEETRATNPEGSNQSQDLVALSESERKELAALLDELLQDRALVVALTFVDGLAGTRELSDAQLREIYLSERKRRGRTRTLASKQWADFLSRFGRYTAWTPWQLGEKMAFEHFVDMERRLFDSLEFSQAVRDYLITKIVEVRQKTEAARDGLNRNLDSLSKKGRFALGVVRDRLEHVDRTLSTKQVAGLTILLSDSSVIFTTRDWSVAGTISTMAAGLTMLASEE